MTEVGLAVSTAVMDTAVVVALLTGGGALLVALISGGLALLGVGRSSKAQRDVEMWKHSLGQEAKQQDRQTAANAVLDRYRKPLLVAADDLGHRVNNIRLDGFFEWYLVGQDRRRQLALRTTLFRFAKYFGWIELLDRQVTYLDFEDVADTKAVSLALRDVGVKFASDKRGTSLMLWREEQRAIGGLMQQPGDPPGIMGFEAFDQSYDDRFSDWFAAFAEDLQGEGVESSERLAELQENLAALVMKLDPERRHAATESGWLQNTEVHKSSGAPGRAHSHFKHLTATLLHRKRVVL